MASIAEVVPSGLLWCHMEIRISPNFTSSKITGELDDYIDVYSDRIRGWLLAPAKALLGVPHAEIAVLTLCLTYFEGLAIYRSGESSDGKSRAFFQAAIDECFSSPPQPAKGHEDTTLAADFNEQLGDLLYKGARCGLFHAGFLRKKVLLQHGLPTTLATSVHKASGRVELVLIEPTRLIADIEAHHEMYMRELRDEANVEARDKFLKAFRLDDPESPVYFPDKPIA